MTWWTLTLLDNDRAQTVLTVLARTNHSAHLFMAWAIWEPARHPIYRTVRGKRLFCGYKYIWDTPNLVEQTLSGNTFEHIFVTTPVTPADHIWYYLFSTETLYDRRCQSALIHVEPPEIEMASARIYRSVPQTIPSHATTVLTFDSVLWDDYSFFNPTNPDRLSIPAAALYDLGCSFRFATTQPAGASAHIRIAGGPQLVYHSHYINGNNWPGAGFSLHTLMRLQPGDAIQVSVYHTSGPVRDIAIDPLSSPHFWIRLVAAHPI